MKFNFEDYKKYCSANKLKENKVENLFAFKDAVNAESQNTQITIKISKVEFNMGGNR